LRRQDEPSQGIEPSSAIETMFIDEGVIRSRA